MKYVWRKLMICSVLFFLLSPVSSHSDTNVGGNITSATTWTLANSPYVVTDTIYVYLSARLTIEAGVTVRFNSGTALWVGHPSADNSSNYRGGLTAEGTSDAKITFTSSSGSNEGWQGIIFGPRSDDYVSSSLNYCIVENAGETNHLGEQSNIHLYYTGQGNAVLLNQVEINDGAGAGLFTQYSTLDLSDSTVAGNAGHGLYSENSILNTTNTFAISNDGHGCYISGSAGTFDGGSVAENGGHGIMAESTSSTTFSDMTISGNGGYGVYVDDFQSHIDVHGSTFNNNTEYPARISAQSTIYENLFSNTQKTGIELIGGTLADRNARWYLPGTGDYQPYLHTDITAVISSRYLTVDPGVTVKFNSSSSLQIGHFNNDGSTSYRGGLTVNGTIAEPVLFTSYSGEPGGWCGIIMGPRSDDNMTSTLNYLTIENAGELNANGVSANLMIYYAGGNSTSFTNCFFNKSTGYGIYANYSALSIDGGGASGNGNCGISNNSSTFNGNNLTISENQADGIFCQASGGSITDSTVATNSGYGIYLTASSLSITDNSISDNGIYAVYYDIEQSNPVISGNTFSENGSPGIRISGGLIAGNHTMSVQTGEPYFTITDADLAVWLSRTLTIDPGVTLKFSSGVGAWIGHPSNDSISDYRGILIAEGTEDAKITFTSLSGSSNGWPGIIFGPRSDDTVSSSLKYCIVENAGESNYLGEQANVYLNYTGSSFILENIAISHSGDTGICLNASIFNASSLWLSSNNGDGLFASASTGNLIDSFIINNNSAGLRLNASSLSITNTYIAANNFGVYCDNAPAAVIQDSIITDNSTYGLYATASATAVNAENNYWGDTSGPYDGSDDTLDNGLYNPDGLGDPVSDLVDYDSWTANVTDSDGDEIPDDMENLVGTDPLKVDTDGDGLSDSWEIQNDLNPLDPPAEDTSSNDSGGSGGGCFIERLNFSLSIPYIFKKEK